jgi:hypothetical protein
MRPIGVIRLECNELQQGLNPKRSVGMGNGRAHFWGGNQSLHSSFGRNFSQRSVNLVAQAS